MNQLQTVTQNQIQFSDEQISVIRNQIAAGATDLELKSFIWQCQRTGLDPFARQIYFIKSGGKVQIQTSIDGFRVIAERSGNYEGQTSAQWCGEDGIWKDIWISNDFPAAARIGVYKKGFREALYAVAHWVEYFAQPGFMHKKMPALMLAKVAESLALRKAFPNEMSGLYTQEEMAQGQPQSRIHVDQPSDEEHAKAQEVLGYVCDFGQWNGRTLDQICRENSIESIDKYYARLESYLKTDKYPENHDKFRIFMKLIDKHLAELENGKPQDYEDDVP